MELSVAPRAADGYRPRLRAALEAGVRARAEATPVLGSDLSGGLDSTTLAFYADRYARQLVTVRQDA